MARFTRAICCLVKFAQPVKRQTSIEHRWMARVKRAMTEKRENRSIRKVSCTVTVMVTVMSVLNHNVLRYITLCVINNDDPQLCR